MDEKQESLQERLVMGRKRDGRRQYDEAAKAELVRACLRPGTSIARTAMTYGVNPNLVRMWIAAHQRKHSLPQGFTEKPQTAADAIDLPREASAREAFIPVISTTVTLPDRPPRLGMLIALHVRLPNGVQLDLERTNVEELTTIIEMLGRLPCSGSTTR